MAFSTLQAGAAAVDITPQTPVHLAGYPYVRRVSTGVHDPLLASALCLQAGDRRVLFIANDVIYVAKAMVAKARKRIAERTGIAEDDILISATHTHSGPKMLDPIATVADEAVPPADPVIVGKIEDGIVEAGIRAAANMQPAEIGLAVADAIGVGTNRRDPDGPRDLNVPVLVVRDLKHRPLAAMLVCSMHPTVLHEDSTLISGDFPGLARQQLQREILGTDCPVLYHTGPAGDQSPRHVTCGNTFAEAERLGDILASAAAKAIATIEFHTDIAIDRRTTTANLSLRSFPAQADAQMKLDRAAASLAELQSTNASKTQIRTAEVDWFGAKETLSLVKSALDGRVAAAAASCMPAEIQAIRIGPWNFVAWPGETFIQFALDVKKQIPGTFITSYTNGELQGYLVTQQAVDGGGYESSNAIFKSPESGNLLVQKTLELLR